jgi:transcriptional regulator with XRE-family HTH domain
MVQSRRRAGRVGRYAESKKDRRLIQAACLLLTDDGYIVSAASLKQAHETAVKRLPAKYVAAGIFVPASIASRIRMRIGMENHTGSFGDKLRDLRKHLNKSQVEVVDELRRLFPEMRISQTALSALELRPTAPRGDVLDMLVQYYGVPVTYFYEAAPHQSNQLVADYLYGLRVYTPDNPARFAFVPGCASGEPEDDDWPIDE